MNPPIHLPPAHEFGAGLEYRYRSFRSGAGDDLYVTTGVFAVDAPDATAPYLRGCGVLFLDMDAADMLFGRDPTSKGVTGKVRKDRIKLIKQSLHHADSETLTRILADLREAFAQATARAGLPPPSVLVCSGYGYHAYYWLQPGETTDCSRLREIQKRLIREINGAVGFDLADTAVNDSGTRVLRVPGTINGKGIPRPVQIVDSAPVRTPLQWFDNRLNRSTESIGHSAAAPEPRKSAQGAHKVFEAIRSNPEKALRGLGVMFDRCPFIRWCLDNPTAVGLESWRAVGVNIAAVAGEAGREKWHEFSRRDPTRYSREETDKQYGYALESAARLGPVTYDYIASLGEWPSEKQPVKSPAMLAVNYADAPDITGLEGIRTDVRGFIKPTAGNFRKILRAHPHFGNGALRINRMGCSVEFRGERIRNDFFGFVGEVIEDEYSVAFASTTIERASIEIAWEHAYHPVEDYLNRVRGTWDGFDRMPWMLSLMGARIDRLTLEYLRVFLLGAVARGLCTDPHGVKFDYVLTLQGEQSAMKSWFFSALAGPGMFADSELQIGNKDSLLSVNDCWIRELAELDVYFCRAGGERKLKAFITSQIDHVRPPYARIAEAFPRRSVFGATVNRKEFLDDETGNRRYMIIGVRQRIPYVEIERHRDQIWAQAVSMYDGGEKWWIHDPELEFLQASDNGRYVVGEPWENLVREWIRVQGINATTIDRVLTDCVGKESQHWTIADRRTVSAILTAEGFRKQRIQRDGARVIVFHRDATDDAIRSAIGFGG